ncbi:MAG: response regulator [Proteobacteria bacterium]|nr:response regulator [Pseudomonadota bacterium]MBU1737251.1 response regulator [Pseudomonadota bacterium]
MKKILLVDDEIEELKILALSLDCKEINAEIITASSGEEALSIIEKEGISLLITDVHMPGMNGMELILAASAIVPDLAFIVMTAFPTAEIKRDALLGGCLRFIEKPYDIELLRGSVIEALTEQKGFTGTMAGIELSDMIQLNCLSCNTVALKIRDGKKSGMIFFDSGNIVHAIAGDIEGEEAFYRIMAFGGGNIESRRNVRPPVLSIEKSYVGLLLEASRRKDETASRAVTQPEEKELPQAGIFRALAKVAGYIGAAILHRNGVLLAEEKNGNSIDLNSGGTVIADLFRLASQTTTENGLEKCDSIVLESTDGTLATRSAGSKGEFLLVALVAPDCNPTLMQIKMASLAPQIRAN